MQPAISCAAPLSVGDLVAEAARAAQVQPAIGELTPLAQPFAAPVTGDALMERAGHLVTHPMQAASAHTSEFQLPAAQLATCCAPVEGRATMDYDAIELADDGLRRQFGYLRLQCGRRLCKQSQEHAGHTHNRFSSYINGFSEDGQGWFPAEPGSCWLLLADKSTIHVSVALLDKSIIASSASCADESTIDGSVSFSDTSTVDSSVSSEDKSTIDSCVTFADNSTIHSSVSCAEKSTIDGSLSFPLQSIDRDSMPPSESFIIIIIIIIISLPSIAAAASGVSDTVIESSDRVAFGGRVTGALARGW